jgi:hypothetical protein
MARRKMAAAGEEQAVHHPETAQPENPQAATEPAETPPAQVAEAAGAAPPSGPIAAPPQGEGRAYTIDNRLGYRKEDSPDGKRRQIRFAAREGGQRPDDETLAAVRDQKPEVAWTAKETAWQARKTVDGLEAIDSADQKLAELGRKRTGGPER